MVPCLNPIDEPLNTLPKIKFRGTILAGLGGLSTEPSLSPLVTHPQMLLLHQNNTIQPADHMRQ